MENVNNTMPRDVSKMYACNDQAAKKALIKLNYVPKKKVAKNYPRPACALLRSLEKLAKNRI